MFYVRAVGRDLHGKLTMRHTTIAPTIFVAIKIAKTT